MSLNGLAETNVTDAYQSAIAEAGGWLVSFCRGICEGIKAVVTNYFCISQVSTQIRRERSSGTVGSRDWRLDGSANQNI
jgi:hypothetical protein